MRTKYPRPRLDEGQRRRRRDLKQDMRWIIEAPESHKNQEVGGKSLLEARAEARSLIYAETKDLRKRVDFMCALKLCLSPGQPNPPLRSLREMFPTANQARARKRYGLRSGRALGATRALACAPSKGRSEIVSVETFAHTTEGDQLYRWRREQKLTLLDLASRTGLSVGDVSGLEAGRYVTDEWELLYRDFQAKKG